MGLVLLLVVLAFPELLHRNSGKSKSSGGVSNGQLENAWLLPYRGNNFRYFSPLSYYVLNRGYVDHRVHATVTEAYFICATTCPKVAFRLMECSRKHGGRMLPHRTHQNGLSVDFMLPKKRQDAPFTWLDGLGIWHYLLAADDRGRYFSGIEIDFETVGRHILALDDAARNSGLRIKKVILQVNLKDEFYATPSGKQVRQRGIYLVKSLPKLIDELHDDHYHVDFEAQVK